MTHKQPHSETEQVEPDYEKALPSKITYIDSSGTFNVSDPFELLRTQNCEDWHTCAEIVQEWKLEAFKCGVFVGALITALFWLFISYLQGTI